MTALHAPTRQADSAHELRDEAASRLTAEALRDYAALAAVACDAAFATVTVRELEALWVRGSEGDQARVPDYRALHEYTLLSSELLEVSAPVLDGRFAPGATAGPLFYAGVPLLAPDGRAFGAIAVMDQNPRRLSADQRGALNALARQLVMQVNLTAELTLARTSSSAISDETHKSLRQMQMLYLNTFEQAPIGIAYANRQGQFLRCNRAFGQMLGYSPAELESMSIGQLTHESDFGHNSAEIARLWRGEIDSYSLEKRYVRKDKSPIWVRVSAALVRDAQGVPDCSVGFLEAISDRKQMEQALQQSKSLLEAAISDIPFAIMACGVDGRIFMSNPAAADLFGVSAAVGATSGTTLEYPPDLEVCQADRVTPLPLEQLPLARALRGEIVSDVELVITRQGKPRIALLSARQLVGHSGAGLGAVVVAQDITGRKESDVELERVHKQLLDASRLAGMAEVASNVLHNVGNVLTSVNVSANLVAECVKSAKIEGLGRAAALLKEREQDLVAFLTTDERGRKLPAYLAQLAEHLLGNQRLALKELAALRDNIDHIKETVAMQQSYAKLCGVAETVAISSLVEDSLRMNAAALARHGVNVRREFDHDVPAVSVDKHKILQILVNLIRNAKYACDESGRADKLMVIRIQADQQAVRISVIDNGVGIHPDNMGRLFRHGFTTRKTGHGFGLHSGALAAKELGGSLTVASDGPGCGATFTLELPLGGTRG
jgi:PAS domain S-box-containing protein